MLFDIFIIAILLWTALTGWRNGLLKELVSSLGFIVGLAIAATCYSQLGDYLAMNGSESNITLNIVAFFLLWIIVPIFLGFVANMLTKAMSTICLGWVNSIGGLVVSVAKYVLLLSCVLNVMSMLGIVDEERKASSRLIAPIEQVVSLLFNEAKAHADKERNNEGDTTVIDIKAIRDSIQHQQ